ncbi:MAG: 50S ribosomal protein L14 [Candidatus Methanomethyliaceae archaeon]|nr:50S ribosomal protein L14 [Candidatus Methanomethyliaceae archaeon]MDW7970347.1 50S ribosomal protein L14 [Nitrososphaerota archaeon]
MAKRGKGLGKGITYRPGVSAGLPIGAYLTCADNSGAKIVQIIGIPKLKGRLRRLVSACVGDKVIVTVKEGTPEVRHQTFHAVIVRQRKPFRRMDGYWIQFEDNAAVIVTEDGECKGTEIRGPVAKEAAERWPRVAALASIVI